MPQGEQLRRHNGCGPAGPPKATPKPKPSLPALPKLPDAFGPGGDDGLPSLPKGKGGIAGTGMCQAGPILIKCPVQEKTEPRPVQTRKRSDDDDDQPSLIYRGGGSSPSNLRLRPGEKALSFRDELKNPPLPWPQVFKDGKDYIAVDPSKLPPGSVVYDGGTDGMPPGPRVGLRRQPGHHKSGHRTQGKVSRMNSDDRTARTVIRAMVDVSTAFAELAGWLRERPRAVTGGQSCWMSPAARRDDESFSVGTGDGLIVEWYADAEFDFGSALTYALELTLDGKDWLLDASARAVGAVGEEVLVELPTRRAGEDDVLDALRQTTEELVRSRDEALALFMRRYGS